MQGALEWLGVPYTGSGVLASALTMDKIKTKRVVVGAGFAAPEYAVLSGPADLPPALERIGLPMMVKPASQGSSVGITQGQDRGGLAARLRRGAQRRSHRLRRALHRGRGAHGGRAAGPRPAVDSHRARDRVLRLRGEVLPQRHASITVRADSTMPQRPSCRPPRSPPFASPIAAAGDASTSCARRRRSRFYFIEINTTPGMTDHSLVPMAARQAGIDFEELVWRVLETSFVRERK